MRFVFLIALALVSGCAARSPLPLPSMSELSTSVRETAGNTAYWIPLIPAAIIAASGDDARISNRAVENNPVFGDIDSAEKFSNDGRDMLAALAVSTVLLAPKVNNEKSWLQDKGQNLAYLAISQGLTEGTTAAMKEMTRRDRPNGKQDTSFPSGHATAAAAYATETTLNLERMSLAPWQRALLKTGVYTVATGVAWARVEANKHYPTDVLVGMSLGTFVSEVFYSSALRDRSSDYRASLTPLPGGVSLNFSTVF